MISLEQMLMSSVHLGHEIQKWNPKMGPYIYGERNGVHIIDLLQTLVCIEKASNFLEKITKKGGKVLFVCTKRQFTNIVEECALNTNSYYVTNRWLGGMLTNWTTIKNCINSLATLNKEEEEGIYLKLTKKEGLILKKRKQKLEKNLSGIKNMQKLPEVVIIIGQNKEMNAVKECLKLGIPTITILDTNCDPTLTEFLIPANDDSVSSVSLILSTISKSIHTS